MKNNSVVHTIMVVMLLSSSSISFARHKPSARDIKQTIIDQSISSYQGNCPCPYNRASNGYKCGKRSAWSKHGGYTPICYKQEVTQAMIDHYAK